MANDAASSNTKVTKGVAVPEVPSAFSLFKPSWEGIKLNLTELIMFFLVPMAALTVYFVITAAAGTANNNGLSALGVIMLAIGVLAAIVYGVLLGPALVHIQLKSARMERVSYQSAWETSKKFWWRFLVLSIAVGLTILVGLLLFIVPGIIFVRRYFLSQYVLIDQDLGTGESMRASNELSKGRSMAIFGIIGVDILINLPSYIPLIGWIVALLLQIAYFCAPAIRYDQLRTLMPKPAAAGKKPA